MSTMKTVVFEEGCAPKDLCLADMPRPVPGPGQLLVRVHAVGVNRADCLQRMGHYPPPPGASPLLGLELAGEVVTVGDDVTGFYAGNRVYGLVEGGAYAEYCLMAAPLAMRIPEGWDYSFAAAITETFFTAHETLFTLGGLTPGERVLIHAGGSGVGSTAIQMAASEGAFIFTTAGSGDKLRQCAALGAQVTINYKEEDFEQVIKGSGEGVDLVEDFIGAAYLERHLRVLKRKGRLIVIGFLGGLKAEVNLGLVLTKQLQILGSVMRSLPLVEKAAIRDRFEKKWLPLLLRGELKPVIFDEIPFERAGEAHYLMEENRHFGKIVLRISG